MRHAFAHASVLVAMALFAASCGDDEGRPFVDGGHDAGDAGTRPDAGVHVGDAGVHVGDAGAHPGDAGIHPGDAGGPLDDGGAHLEPDACVSDCTPDPVCGNGELEAGEACDDGNATTESSCPYGVPSCTACDAECAAELPLSGPTCGDGVLQGGHETCDDGNVLTETACPYGFASCFRCDATCENVLALTGPYCGDTVVNGSEVCDDGNALTETECPYGSPACTRCDATCSTPLALTGAYCGDGVVTLSQEPCDDGSAHACGTCSADCQTATPPAAATGSLTVPSGSSFRTSGDTFAVSDGFATVVFEYDRSGSCCTNGRVPIAIASGDDAATVAAATASVVNDSALMISAAAKGATVSLTHELAGAFGNLQILETVQTSAFTASGMSGGAGRDCPAGTGCLIDDVCDLGLVCTGSVCDAPPGP